MHNVLTLVLGGGRGARLYPLTKYRSKPAVPVAGKYRLIDIPLSNCLNSGLNRIYILTQFNSVSLHRHIRRAYQFDHFGGGFVELLAAQQTMERSDWYQGTADAVRANLRYLQQPGIDYVLILSGDQLYRMDYRDMFKTHRAADADVTIAALPVAASQASSLGIMRLNDSGRVVGFLEKPQTKEELALVRTDHAWLTAHGLADQQRDCLANMGIYLFNRDTLVDLLEKTSYWDFGKEIFPASIRTHHVQVHMFDGYWEDIGTIRSFYEANLQLAGPDAPFQLRCEDKPIYSRARFLSPSRIESAKISRSLIGDGCSIEDGAVIENSLIGLRCRIGRNVVIRNSIIMGSDWYQTEAEAAADCAAEHPVVGIGDDTVIEGAIVDKNCRIGSGVRVANDTGEWDSSETPEAMIRDGVIVVTRGALLPDGWELRHSPAAAVPTAAGR
jgi:glucose-1-phosphate adenylyltransferase